MLAVPRKSWPGAPGVPVPPNVIYRHYFDRDSLQAVPDDIEVDSFAEYWEEISYGQVTVSGDVLGWVEIPWWQSATRLRNG